MPGPPKRRRHKTIVCATMSPVPGELVSTVGVCYRNKSPQKHMEQNPRKEGSDDMVVPEPPAPTPPEDPAPVLRPEDEALVAERLRELGYIE